MDRMRMSSSSSTPRKFSEKIAILERKQNEENTTFEDIMREVRSITHDTDPPNGAHPMAIPQQSTSGGLLPPQPWNTLGGSLPNVHQMPSYSPPMWTPNWQTQATNHQRMMIGAHRSRSPEANSSHHFHPYGLRAQTHSRSPDRVPPLHMHYTQYPPNTTGGGFHHGAPGHLVPPNDSWNQINRARSDSAIHNMGHHDHQISYNGVEYSTNYFGQMPGTSEQKIATPHESQQGSPTLQMGAMTNGAMGSPLQSPVNSNMMHPMYSYPNGSPMQSPMGSPHASSLMLDGSNTPCMELSPPAMHHEFSTEVGSLPNLQHQHHAQFNNYYHPPVGPRHSTGTCGPRLVPGPVLTPESQSAPTSPHSQAESGHTPQWKQARTFSNSPEALDIPKLVLTNAEGAPGQHLEFNDLQDPELHLLCNGGASTQYQETAQVLHN